MNMEKELARIQEECQKLSKYRFSFENIVFQAAGLKGIAYAGVFRALELAGAVYQLRRVAGSGTGALAAAMAAASLTSLDMEAEFNSNKPNYNAAENAACGLINLKRQYGWNSTDKVASRFGDILKKKFGNANVTFKEVYDRTGIELCIVVTNVSRTCEEYCHAKTTPHLPVKVAVKMSLAVPGLFKACRHTLHDSEDYYVDGSVVTPYPLHCFDGWYLSLKPEDSFLNRLYPLPRTLDGDSRFGSFNSKTVGVVTFANNDQDTLRRTLEVRDGCLDGRDLIDIPHTDLLRNANEKRQKNSEQHYDHKRFIEAARRLLEVFSSSSRNIDSKLTRNDLDDFIIAGSVQQEIKIIFGEGATAKEVFKCITKEKMISFRELVQYLEAKSSDIYSWMYGQKSSSIASLADFNRALHATSTYVNAKAYLKSQDNERTIGINTGYVESRDTKIEPRDQQFLLLQGMRATLAYLQFCVRKYNPPLRNGESTNHNVPDTNWHSSQPIMQVQSQPSNQVAGHVKNAPASQLAHAGKPKSKSVRVTKSQSIPVVSFAGVTETSHSNPAGNLAAVTGSSGSISGQHNIRSRSLFQASASPAAIQVQGPILEGQWVTQSFFEQSRTRPTQPQFAQPNLWDVGSQNPFPMMSDVESKGQTHFPAVPVTTHVPVTVHQAPVTGGPTSSTSSQGQWSPLASPSSFPSIDPPHYSQAVSDQVAEERSRNAHLYPTLPSTMSRPV